MNKNILIVTATYFPDLGGAGIVAKNISEELIKNGYNVTVFCGGKINKTEKINGVNIIRNNTSKSISPLCLENYYNSFTENTFLRIVKNYNINIIHFHSIQGLGANLIEIALKNKIKTILTMHDFWWECPMLFLNNEYMCSMPAKKHQTYCNTKSSKSFLYKRKKYLYEILRNNKLTITTVSETMKESLEYIGLPNASQYICIQNGFLKIKSPLTNHKKKKSKIQFAYFGGENLSKGFDTLINASSYLKFNTNNFVINLYGIHRPFLKKILNLKFLKKYNIKLNGIYENKKLPQILSNIDVVIIPSRMYESFSLIAREALLNNKIVISSNMGALSELKTKRHIIFNKTSSLDLSKKMFFTIKNFKKIKENPININTITLEEQIELYQKNCYEK